MKTRFLVAAAVLVATMVSGGTTGDAHVSPNGSCPAHDAMGIDAVSLVPNATANPDAKLAWGIGDMYGPYTVVSTEDGRTWNALPDGIPTVHCATLAAIATPTPTDIYIVGTEISSQLDNGFIATSHDSGGSWSVKRFANQTPWAISFVGNRGFVVTYVGDINTQPHVLWTTDGGNHWIRGTLPHISTPTMCMEVARGSISRGWLLCSDYYHHYSTQLLTTTDGGKTWSNVPAFPQRLYDAGRPAAVGNDVWVPAQTSKECPCTVLSSHDGGTTWSHTTAPRFHGDAMAIDIQTSMLSASSGYLIAENVSAKTVETSTTSNGSSWSRVPASLKGVIPISAVFLNHEIGWVSGAQDPTSTLGVIYGTTNGGKTWTLQWSGSASPH